MNKFPYEIIEKDGFPAIKTENSSVAVLLYTLDENDHINKVGVVIEKNPHFTEGSYTGIILGTVEKDDASLLSRAKKEAKEEGGYEIPSKKWDFLGEMYTSKLFPESIYCYAADVTGLTKEAPTGDGSDQEKDIKFTLLAVNKIEKIPDSVLQACFFKLFTKLYKHQLI